ncbi:MAG: cytochrome c biogenesis protein CcdA [Acidobacteriia bacterium]|nr:cytochrome c biogenesis protein CcdA [Terriglobia bacterium]
MESSNIGLITAFVAGIVSFLSPCVLPLVPAYLSYITGVSVQDIREEETAGKGRMGRLLIHSLMFVLGFTVVFVALGASATSAGRAIHRHHRLFLQIAGIIIIVFGLHLIGLFKIGLLYREKRFQNAGGAGIGGSFLIGLAFAFGWTPCIGPILAGILTIAATRNSVWQGVWLLTIYSLGLGLPFLIVGLSLNKFMSFYNAFKKHLRVVEVVSGILLIAIGALILTNNLNWLAQKFSFLNRFAL